MHVVLRARTCCICAILARATGACIGVEQAPRAATGRGGTTGPSSSASALPKYAAAIATTVCLIIISAPARLGAIRGGKQADPTSAQPRFSISMTLLALEVSCVRENVARRPYVSTRTRRKKARSYVSCTFSCAALLETKPAALALLPSAPCHSAPSWPD